MAKYLRLWAMFSDGSYEEEYVPYGRAVRPSVALSAFVASVSTSDLRVLDSGWEVLA
jgi:hypothetical protein